jgi:hypothetical protein
MSIFACVMGKRRTHLQMCKIAAAGPVTQPACSHFRGKRQTSDDQARRSKQNEQRDVSRFILGISVQHHR